MLVVTQGDIAKLHKALTDLKDKRALSHAAKDGLNTSAFAVRREWKAQGHRTMIVRNKWTFGGKHHRVVKARATKNINAMEAVTGNKLKYMLEQERGVSRFALWRKGVPIPTKKSRKGGKYTNLMRGTFWRRNIKLGRRLKESDAAFHKVGQSGKDRRSRYIAASIAHAKRQGSRFVYLDLGSWGRGIFDVQTKTKMKKVWQMNRRSTFTKPNPMLARTLRTLRPAFPTYHRMALEQQVRFVKTKRGIR
jgi:hypothetical protein